MLKIIPWLPGILGMAALSFISHLPGSSLPPLMFDWADKLFHFMAYGGLAFLFYLRVPLWRKLHSSLPVNHYHYWVFVLGGAHAVLDECHQILIPLRTFSIFDMAANLFGFFFFYAVFLFLDKHMRMAFTP